jgi:hypothetical protein
MIAGIIGMIPPRVIIAVIDAVLTVIISPILYGFPVELLITFFYIMSDAMQ